MTPDAQIKIPDGGPAFPLVDGKSAQEHSYLGMTLRDYFAAKALQAIVSQARLNSCGDFVAGDCLLQHHNAPKYAAITSYQFADAMLEARSK